MKKDNEKRLHPGMYVGVASGTSKWKINLIAQGNLKKEKRG